MMFSDSKDGIVLGHHPAAPLSSHDYHYVTHVRENHVDTRIWHVSSRYTASLGNPSASSTTLNLASLCRASIRHRCRRRLQFMSDPLHPMKSHHTSAKREVGCDYTGCRGCDMHFTRDLQSMPHLTRTRGPNSGSSMTRMVAQVGRVWERCQRRRALAFAQR